MGGKPGCRCYPPCPPPDNSRSSAARAGAGGQTRAGGSRQRGSAGRVAGGGGGGRGWDMAKCGADYDYCGRSRRVQRVRRVHVRIDRRVTLRVGNGRNGCNGCNGRVRASMCIHLPRPSVVSIGGSVRAGAGMLGARIRVSRCLTACVPLCPGPLCVINLRLMPAIRQDTIGNISLHFRELTTHSG